MKQPFSTQQMAEGAYFTDREAEIARVLEAMRNRDRLLLYGERRMGKSSVIARAAEGINLEGGTVITADAWTMDDLDDLNRALTEAIPMDWLVGDRLASLIRAFRSVVSVTADEDGRPTLRFSGSTSADPEADQRLARILHGLDDIAAGSEGPIVVVIDEFQRMEDVHPGGGGLLRHVVQETPHLGYIFSGSIIGLVMELVGPKGPFHAIDRLEIKGIDADHLVPWLKHRLKTHGVGITDAGARSIHSLAGPVTEYIMRLAKVVYRRNRDQAGVGPALVDEAFEEVVADYAGSFEIIWDGLASSKRQVLRAVADGEQKLNSKEVLDRYDLSSSSAATYAINELRHDGLLAPEKPYRVSDPFFAAWIRRGP